MCTTCHRRLNTSTVSQRTSYIATAANSAAAAAAAADDDDGDDATWSQSHSNSVNTTISKSERPW